MGRREGMKIGGEMRKGVEWERGEEGGTEEKREGEIRFLSVTVTLCPSFSAPFPHEVHTPWTTVHVHVY